MPQHGGGRWVTTLVESCPFDFDLEKKTTGLLSPHEGGAHQNVDFKDLYILTIENYTFRNHCDIMNVRY